MKKITRRNFFKFLAAAAVAKKLGIHKDIGIFSESAKTTTTTIGQSQNGFVATTTPLPMRWIKRRENENKS